MGLANYQSEMGMRMTNESVISNINEKITMICADGVLSLANHQGQTGMRMMYESLLLLLQTKEITMICADGVLSLATRVKRGCE